MIAALLKAGDYDASKDTASVVKMTEQLGVPLDRQTVGKYLKQIPEAIDARKKVPR